MKHILPLFLICLSLTASRAPALTGGREVTDDQFREVVQIGPIRCAASIVGPHALLTAAHCVQKTGDEVRFSIGGAEYAAKVFLNPLYSGSHDSENDFALAVSESTIAHVKPVQIAGEIKKGSEITLLGYGCARLEYVMQPDGISVIEGRDFGRLHVGISEVVYAGSANYFVSRRPNGAVICLGDGGGPAYLATPSGPALVGIASASNIVDTNYHTRLDSAASRNALTSLANEKNVAVCGINALCR